MGINRVVLLSAIVMVAVLLAGCQATAPPPSQPKASGASPPTPVPAASEKATPKEVATAAAKAPEKPAAKEVPTATAKAAEKAPATAKAASAEQELYEAAKKEGEVIWISTSFEDETLEMLLAGFEKKYPGIKVTTTKNSSAQIVRRAVVEASTGRLAFDVGMGGVDEMGPLKERDLLVGFDWPKIADVPASSILIGSMFLSAYDLTNGWVYNKNLVTTADVPKTWEDLLSPKWKGRKLAVMAAGAVGIEAQRILGKWDQAKYAQFLNDLKAQELVIESSGAGLAQRVADGQLPMGMFPITLVPSLLQKGAPLEIAPLGPLVTKRFGVYTFKGVPHPNAAKLLMGYVTSTAARPAWAKGGRGSAAPCDASELAKLLCDKKVEVTLDDGMERSAQLAELLQLNRAGLGLPAQ